MSSFSNCIYCFGMEPIEIKSIFTSNIKKYRGLSGMTQMQLAEAADISVGFLCDLESGKKWGTLETMAKLANALHIKPYQLLMPENEKDQATNIHEDLSELSKNLKYTIDSQIDTLIKHYAE